MKALIAAVIIIVGLLCIAAGIVYIVEPAHSLPSFFPSHTSIAAAGANVKHKNKGLAGVIVGVVLLGIGIVVAFAQPRPAPTSGPE